MRIFSLIKRFLALEGAFGPEQDSGFSMHALPFLPLGFAGKRGGYQIANSVRLRGGASAYFSRIFDSSGDRQKFTISIRFKRGTLGASQNLILTDSSGTSHLNICINANDTITVRWYNSSVWDTTPSPVFRDTTGFYHLVFAFDTTQATSSNRLKIYAPTLADGNETTPLTAGVSISQNDSGEWNQAGVAHYIGKAGALGSNDFDGVIAEVIHVDGQQLDATYFGERNADNVWVPKAYTGTYGTNGFKLDFKDAAVTSGSNAGLGKDVSGNGNYWNTNNISVTAGATYDALTDTPTNNFATLNPLANTPFGGTTTFSAGNLQVTTNTSRQHILSSYRLGPEKKYYWECSRGNASSSAYQTCGIAKINTAISSSPNSAYPYNVWGYNNAGSKSADGVQSGTYTASSATTDVWGFEWDGPNSTLTCYLNNTSLFSVTGLTGEYVPYFGIETPCDIWVNFGQRPFSYTHSGFNSLCTANLPSVAILDPSLYAKVVKRTSAGGTYTNSSLAFQPDLALIKAYSNTDNYYLQDVVRGFGASKSVSTNQSGAEGANGGSPGTQSFTPASDGYSLSGGDFNTSGYSYVDLLLKLGGTAVSASGGSGYSSATISANSTIGISVIKLTTNVASGGSWSVNHGLSGTPDMVIFKRTNSADNWPTYLGPAHASPLDNYWLLNGSGSNSASTGIFNISSTVVGSSNSFVSSGDTVLIICIKSIPGFSKVGAFTGNGSTDGPYIHTGFTPEFLVGRTTTTASNWLHLDGQRDTYNAMKSSMYIDSTAYEGTATDRIDKLAGGFKVRDSNAVMNNSNTVFYWTMAKHPFGGSNVAPAPAR